MIIAESIFSRIGNLRKVMSDPQIACLLSGTKGVESEHYKYLIIKVDDIVAKCPVTYQTDGQGDNAICQMHYFKGDSDVYIVELDVAGPPHTQAYGVIRLNGGYPELGYIDLDVLIKYGFELDLYYAQQTVGEVMRKLTYE
ncbi:hypothetical protein [Acinetobacter baumannii]|uniref:hypothetical protein n=1 Tax=Acinetobacter baumannii TaxID=470 RepID=UPI001EE86169|nr:hypothetical protein [Acinetobacter baumannii]MCG5873268.1 hypothetical protein [Acinetobacter baumannii]MDV4318500.1 hypothetical protein [Acinetobacter baumannii]HCG3427903.1 hypothetical protein [Acinetobacter baumannii]